MQFKLELERSNLTFGFKFRRFRIIAKSVGLMSQLAGPVGCRLAVELQLYRSKADMPNSNTAIIWTPIIEGYVGLVWISERRPKRLWGTCFKEVGARVKNTLTILGSVINMIRGSIWPFQWAQESSLYKMKQKFIRAPKNYEAHGYGHDLHMLTILHKLCVSYHNFMRSGCRV